MTSRLTATLIDLLTKVQQMEARLTLLEGQVFSERATEAASPIEEMSAANAKAYESVGLAAMKGIKKTEGSRPIYLSDGPDGAICIQFAEEAVISLSTEEAKLLAARLMRKLKP